MLISWFTCKNNSEKSPEEQILWLNSMIVINTEPILWLGLIRSGLMHVHQLFVRGSARSAIEVQRAYGIIWLQYNSIMSANPKDWRLELKSVSPKTQTDESSVVCPPKIYNGLIQNTSALSKKRTAWEKELGMMIDHDQFLMCFRDMFKVTNVPKLRAFQFRLLHRAIIVNTQLFKWGKSDSPLCSSCQKEDETYLHLFVFCEKVQELCLSLEQFVYTLDSCNITFGADRVIANKLIDNPANIKNILCLLLKQFIYRQRCLNNKLSFEHFKYYIFQTRNIEKYIAIKNNKVRAYSRKWRDCQTVASDSNLNQYTNEYVQRM